jgi:hypothetical protein
MPAAVKQTSCQNKRCMAEGFNQAAKENIGIQGIQLSGITALRALAEFVVNI